MVQVIKFTSDTVNTYIDDHLNFGLTLISEENQPIIIPCIIINYYLKHLGTHIICNYYVPLHINRLIINKSVVIIQLSYSKLNFIRSFSVPQNV